MKTNKDPKGLITQDSIKRVTFSKKHPPHNQHDVFFSFPVWCTHCTITLTCGFLMTVSIGVGVGVGLMLDALGSCRK